MAFLAPGNFCFLRSSLFQRRGLAVLAITWTGCMAASVLVAGESGSLSSITEREIQRRQQIIGQAGSVVAEAVKLSEGGKHDEAAKLLLKTYEELPNSPVAAPVKDRVRAAYANVSCAWAQQLLAQGRQKEALEVLDAVLAENVDPKNEAVLRMKKHATDPDRYPPALSPTHIANAQQVKTLLIKAGSAVDLGDYDKALGTYAEVIRIDPYNVAARRGMESAERFRSEYFEAARVHHRSKLLNEVSSQWEDPLPPRADLNSMFGGAGDVSPLLSGRDKMEKKLRTMRVPRAEFNGATLEETVEYLRVQSRNLDPQGNGVSFVMNVDEVTKSKSITLNLQDVPLEELLRYVTQMAGAAYRLEDNAVMITSLTEKSVSLITKTYRVPPDFVQTAEVNAAPAAAADPFAAQPAGGAAAGGGMRRMGAKELLISRGVVFPEGGGASFSPSTSLLIVRTTAEQLSMVDLLVEQATGAVQKQVKISVRMIDVSQVNLEEHGSDVAIGQANLPGSERMFFSGGASGTNFKNDASGGTPGPISELPLSTAGLRSTGAIMGIPGIEQLIAQNGETPNVGGVSPSQFALRGVFTDPQIDLIFRQIVQKKGSDVMTMPSVVTKGGSKASIRVVRQFPYPTEFDPPQIPQQVSSFGTSVAQNLLGVLSAQSSRGSGAPVVPTTPTAFETKEVGMILEVEPNISADGRTVEVALSPNFTEFEGFIDYGSDITNSVGTVTSTFINGLSSSSQPPTYIQNNDILQPVFRRNSMTTAVTVYDGSTIVIGGVIEQRSVDIEDKVPVIGNIPLIGSLWQSKVRETTKKNVLLFVTVNVIDPSGQRVNQTTAAAQH